MAIPIQLSRRGVQLSPDQEALVQEAVAGLGRFFDGVASCRVAVSTPNRRPTGGPVTWTIRIGMTVPGAVLAVNRRGRPNFRQALDDTFDAARRRLQDYARGLRGDIKRHVGESLGRVTRLLSYEGYGFITGDDGTELYFHRNSVPDGAFDRLVVGTQVRYVESEGEDGPQASTVMPLGHPAPVPADLP